MNHVYLKQYKFADALQEAMNIFGKDIFLHKKELLGQTPFAGTPVQLSVAWNDDGRPIATSVNLSGGYKAQIVSPHQLLLHSDS